MKIKNIIGKRFGKLLVTKMLSERGKSNQIMYQCICDCGNKHITSGDSLRSGKSKSCGCNRLTPPNKVTDRVYAIKKQLYKTNIIKRSKSLGLDYNITLEDYIKLIEQPCHYCGLESSNYATDRYNTKANGKKTSDTVVHYNGIDRIDNSKGYTKDNTVACCKHCNIAKSTMTQDRFRDWVVKVYNHYCNFIGFEKDKGYYDIACKRVAGLCPSVEPSGESKEDL